MNILTRAIICVLVVTACGQSEGIVFQKANPSPEGFVNAFLQDLWADNIRERESLIISGICSIGSFSSEESRDEFLSVLIREAKVIDKEAEEALLDFCLKNQRDSRFEPKGGLSMDHVVLGADSYQFAPFMEPPTDKLEHNRKTMRELPNWHTTIGLSVPGFSRNGSVGIIYCSALVGYDVFVEHFLCYRRVNGVWENSPIRLEWPNH